MSATLPIQASSEGMATMMLAVLTSPNATNRDRQRVRRMIAAYIFSDERGCEIQMATLRLIELHRDSMPAKARADFDAIASRIRDGVPVP